MSNDKKITGWHTTITPRTKAPQPWTLMSGGSWDMLDVQPIPDDMLAELAQRYHSTGTPWNCRSMPLSDADREYMFLLYYSMQGLVARMRQAEARAQAAPEEVLPVGTLAWALIAKSGNIVIWSRNRSTVEGYCSRYPEASVTPILGASPAATTASTPCTCPSGLGSLRWPCPQHPPEAAMQTTSTDKGVDHE